MKAPQEHLLGPQRPERTLLDQIRNDRELIDRLRITPAEIEVLSKCALLGTLTCKQDMLFILRHIREAGSRGVEQATVVAQPALPDDQEKDSARDVSRTPVHTARAIVPELGSLEGIVRRRLPEQLGVMFWVVVLAVGLAWNGAIMLSRWKDKFATSIGAPAAQTLAPDAWYDKLDRFNVLFWLEILFIAGVALVIYLRSLRSARRFKVKPGQGSGSRYY
jgi:hypothetical protein